VSNDGMCALASLLPHARQPPSLRLLDLATGAEVVTYTGHSNVHGAAVSCCFSEADAEVATGSDGGSVVVWDLVSAEIVASARAHTGLVTGVAWHPKLPMLATSSLDGTAMVWNIQR
jgi:WD40 repeat protein